VRSAVEREGRSDGVQTPCITSRAASRCASCISRSILGRLCLGLLAGWCLARPHGVGPARTVAAAIVLRSGVLVVTQAGEARDVYLFTPLTAAGPPGEPAGFFTDTAT